MIEECFLFMCGDSSNLDMTVPLGSKVGDFSRYNCIYHCITFICVVNKAENPKQIPVKG